jgi:exosortase family protein XrtM
VHMTNEKSSSGISLPYGKRSWHWIAYVALFLAIFAALDYGYYLTRGTAIERLMIDQLTVHPAAAFINLLVPRAAVTASGHSLLSHMGSINILEGCEGTEAMFLLIAAIVPFPASRLLKLVGAACGVVLVYVLNQLRLLILIISLQRHPDWFGPFHGLIGPTFIVLAGCLFFFVWANMAASRVRT